MVELQAWIGICQFFPELPHPEIFLAGGDVVQQDNPLCADFGEPGFKVPFHVFICMGAVYVEKIDRTVIEGGDGVREVGAQYL